MRVAAVVGCLLLAAVPGAQGYRVPAPASMMAAGPGQQEHQRQRQTRQVASSGRNRRWGRRTSCVGSMLRSWSQHLNLRPSLYPHTSIYTYTETRSSRGASAPPCWGWRSAAWWPRPCAPRRLSPLAAATTWGRALMTSPRRGPGWRRVSVLVGVGDTVWRGWLRFVDLPQPFEPR